MGEAVTRRRRMAPATLLELNTQGYRSHLRHLAHRRGGRVMTRNPNGSPGTVR